MNAKETRQWWRVSFALGKTKRELQKQLTSSEFMEAVVFLDELEWETKNKWEYYAAAILLRILQAFASEEDAKKLKDATLNDMLLVFKDVTDSKENEESMTEEEVVARQQLSEALWRGAIGRAKKARAQNKEQEEQHARQKEAIKKHFEEKVKGSKPARRHRGVK